MEIVGAFFSEELKQGGIQSMNTHQTIYVISPEINLSGQLIFRDNYKMMLEAQECITFAGYSNNWKNFAKPH